MSQALPLTPELLPVGFQTSDTLRTDSGRVPSPGIQVQAIPREHHYFVSPYVERDTPRQAKKDLVVTVFVRRVAVSRSVSPAIGAEPLGLARVHNVLFSG